MAMNSSHNHLKGLYLISNHDQHDDEKLSDDAEEALATGVRVLQYRDKSGDADKRLRQAENLRKLTQQYDCLLLINDDIDLAKQVDADGVHLGKDDGNIDHARALLGSDAIIGASCYNQFERAVQASQRGADYVAFGRFFASATKPAALQANTGLLQQARQQLDLPVVAIGGITHDNALQLIEAGADMLAVINGVFAQHDIRKAAQQFQRLFN